MRTSWTCCKTPETGCSAACALLGAPMTALDSGDLQRLRPHQIALANQVLDPTSPRAIVLTAPVGSGASSAAAAAARAVVRDGGRVLIVAPRMIGEQRALEAAEGNRSVIADLTKAEAR